MNYHSSNIKTENKFWINDSIAAILLACLTIVVLTITAADIGLTWDEPIYMEASENYVSWLGELLTHPQHALSDECIQEYWRLNHEHVPFDKVWSGLIWTGARHLFDDITAHRLGNIILCGGLVALLYLMLAPAYGRDAGLAAAGALLTMPRFFFHSHLAALDVPTAATIFLVSFLFWRTLDRPELKWSLWLGVACGVALATKINALFVVPIMLGIFTFFFRPRFYLFVRLGLMGLIGLVVWLLLWPWLYHDTLNRLKDYIDFMTAHHYRIAQYYHGHSFSPPPWHFPFVMTIMVVPLTLTILAAIGSVQVLVQDHKRGLGLFLMLGVFVPMLIFATRKAQIFDDDRLLMPVFPYIAALAGIGFSQVVMRIRKLAKRWGREKWQPAFIAILVAIAFIPQVAFAYSLYPHLLSYYSETIGGLPGARHVGMETTYWAETYIKALPYLNMHAPLGAMVWVEAHDVMLYYQSHGMLRRDLRIASPFGNEAIVKGMQGYKAMIEDADLAVIEYRESGFSKRLTNWLRGREPVYRLSCGDIELLEIYTR
jgi:4-amino-4-deoxy-L-arabinose transferase-like glycosyltransferase